jgi:hypothetical protein
MIRLLIYLQVVKLPEAEQLLNAALGITPDPAMYRAQQPVKDGDALMDSSGIFHGL